MIGGVIMAKAGMRRPDPREPHGTEGKQGMNIPKNDVKPVPEIQGKAKAGHEKANSINYDGKW
jgi:hypothetical protein